MAGTKGYSTYRGRGSKWKIFAAILLVLVILAAVAVLFLQRYIVYDETGTPHLELPWQTQEIAESPTPPPDNVEITIQPQEEAYIVAGMPTPLDESGWTQTLQRVREDTGRECDAVAITLKDSESRVWYDSAAALSGTVQTVDHAPVAEAVSGEWHSVALLACFQDPMVARHFVTDRGLQNQNGYIFHDGNNSQWLNPAKPLARAYLCAMAAEAAELGFDEILLTDVSYPTEGKLEQIAYGEGTRAEHLLTFLREMRETLAVYDVQLSIELPESVLLTGADETAGLVLSDVVSQVDAIYVTTEESRVETLRAGLLEAGGDDVRLVPRLETAGAEISQYMLG